MSEADTHNVEEQTAGNLYGAEYYESHLGPFPYERSDHWLGFFQAVADNIVQSIGPRTVLDAGCAMGMLVEALWDRNVEARGFDISPYAVARARQDIREYCTVRSVAEPITGDYDLITCFEVLEHVAPDVAEQAIAHMTGATKAILFSSTPADFDEPTHINVQPTIAWLRLFANHGFWPDVLYDASYVAQHAMLLSRQEATLSDSTLALFAELLRVRGFSQERQQESSKRIEETQDELGRLRRESNSLRAQLQERLETVRGQLADQCERTEKAAQYKVLLAERVAQAEDELRVAVHQLAAAQDRLLEVGAASSALQVELAQMKVAHSSAVAQFREAEAGRARLSLKLNPLLEEALSVSKQRDDLLHRLEEIEASPGWKAVTRYRNWLAKSVFAKTWLKRPYEALLSLLLKPFAAKGAMDEPGDRTGAAHGISDTNLAALAAARPDTQTARLMASRERSKFLLIIGGCPGDAHRYRCEHQAEEVRLAGLTADIVIDSEVDYELALNSYQAFMLHRTPHTPDLAAFIERAKAAGKIVLFDTDDLVFNEQVLADIKAVKLLPRHEQELYVDGVRRYNATLSLCPAATVTTEPLREAVLALFPEHQVFVNRNAVSDIMVQLAEEALNSLPEPAAEPVRIAYLSGTPTHNEDFTQCVSALSRLLKEREDVQLVLAGHIDCPPKLAKFGDRVMSQPLVPWQELPSVLRGVHINLAPLESGNRFTDAKSELKYIEAALMGVPTVASDVTAYRHAIRHGETGFLCGNADEWYEALTKLTELPQLRSEVGAKARKDTIRRYTTRSRSPELVRVLRQIYKPLCRTDSKLSIAFVIRAPIAQTGGGYKVIFALADYLAECGHKVRVYVERIAHLEGKSDAEIQEFCGKHFPCSRLEIRVGHDAILPSDVAIATNWPTAFSVARLENTRCRLYFIQDFEPEFYDQSDPLYQESKRTYDLPLKKVVIGRYLSTLFSEMDRLPVPYIPFALDRSVFSVTGTRPEAAPVRVLFFARPGLKRRGFSIGVEALRLLHQRCPDVKIVLYGMATRQELDFEYENLGELSRTQVAEAMNDCHIHLSFSLTNISWVPFEAMACGCSVVEADVPSVRAMISTEEEPCMLVKPEAEIVADALAELVEGEQLRARLSANALRYVSGLPRNWRSAGVEFERIIEESLLRQDERADATTKER